MSPRRREGAKQQVMLISKRGRFLVGEPVFEREGRVALGGGPQVAPGKMALVEFAPGKARVVEALGDPERAVDVIEALMRERGMGRGFPAAATIAPRVAITAAMRSPAKTRGSARKTRSFVKICQRVAPSDWSSRRLSRSNRRSPAIVF